MYTITVNIYKNNQIKWQEQVLLNASSKAEAKQKILRALDKLPENLRMVLILREYTEMNYKEIGRVMGITEGNVKVRVFRAREQLAKLLGEEDVYLPQ